MKETLTDTIDLSQVVKSKLVYLSLYTPLAGASPLNYKYYFEGDSELNNAIITGIQVHASKAQNPYDYADQTFNGAGSFNEYTTIQTLQALTLTLIDFTGRHFWENQVVTSLFVGNTGRYMKRLYNRVKLEECYVTAFGTIGLNPAIDGNNLKFLIPFTFYYIPVNRPRI